MSGTVCCYVGCKKSYSTDKDISFFKFPDDPKRRKKWMQNSGNVALESLPERQLRGKRICSDHFTDKSFQRAESKTALNDSAVPIVAKTVKSEPSPSPAAGRPLKGKAEKKESKEPAKPEPSADKNSKVNVNTDDNASIEETPVPAKADKVLPQRSVTRKSAAKEKAENETASAASATTDGDKASTSVKTVPPGAVSEKDTKGPLKRKNIENPIDPKRRKKGMKNSGDVALESPPERQLRGKRICLDHSTDQSFQKAESKTALNDSAVPIVAKTGKPEPPPSPAAGRSLKGKAEKKESKEPAKPEPAKPEPSADKNSEVNTDDNASIEETLVPVVPVPPAKADKVLPQKSVTRKSAAKEKAESETASTASATTDGNEASTSVKSVPPGAASEKDTNSFSIDITAPTTSVKTVLSGAIAGTNTGVLLKKKKKKKKAKPQDSSQQSKETPGVVSGENTNSFSIDITAPTTSVKTVLSGAVAGTNTGVLLKKKKKKAKPQDPSQQSTETPGLQTNAAPVNKAKHAKKQITDITSGTDSNNDTETAKIIANQVSQMQSVLLPSNTKQRVVTSKLIKPVLQKVEIGDNVSEADSYDEYMYFDRDFEEASYDDDPDGRLDREFERFYASLKKFLHLSGKWTMGGVQWDPQGRRKVIIISEPDIPPHGRPSVKRCLQFFEDKAIRVFIDGMDMTDVFGMSCYAEKEDVAALICRVAEASSCCGVPEMVLDDLVHFPYARKRNTSYFDSDCPGVIPNDSYDPMCSSCKQLQELVMESRKKEKQRLLERRIRSQEKDFRHPFGKALYTMFNDLVDETDPTKPKKKRTKETFFRKYLHDTRYKVDGDSSKTERVYIEKPISVDSVSASFQDIVSKLGFNMPNAKKPKTYSSALSRPPSMPLTSTPKPYKMMTPGSSNMGRVERKSVQVEQMLPFSTGSSFTLGDGQEYEVIGEVDPTCSTEMVEVKHAPSQPQYEIIEVDDETLAKLASAKNPVVVLPDAAASSSNLQVTRIDANDPNLSQILKAINTSHSYKVN